MTAVEAVRTQALQLSPVEREELVQDLLESMPVVVPETAISIDPDFEDELARRVKSVEDGTAKLIDGELFLAELKEWGSGTKPQ